MHLAPVHHRLPRAGLDPIDDAATALSTISMVVDRPLRDETIVALLDDDRCGIAVVVVTGTVDADDAIAVVELLTSPAAHRGRVGAVLVGSVRPGAPADDTDIDRWLEMSDLADAAGVELLEWFVIDEGAVSCPRDLLGEPPRW